MGRRDKISYPKSKLFFFVYILVITYERTVMKMAIFYVNEPVAEQVEEGLTSEELLDNLVEACDSMMTMLDEHGGAYNKYLKNREDAQQKHLDKENFYRDAAEKTTSKKASKSFEDKADKESEAWEKIGYQEYKKGYIPKSNGYNVSSGKNKSATALNHPDNKYFVDDKEAKQARKEDRSAKDKWMEDHGDKGEDKLADREPGTFKKLQDQKKAIKETCLYILSILDEI